MSVARACLKTGRNMLGEAQKAVEFVRSTTARCANLVPERDGAEILQCFDDISDRICQVIDTAEFARSMHANEDFKRKAEIASVTINQCIQELNTNKNLYESLRRIRADNVSWDRLDAEQRRMTENLMQDFEDNGIDYSEQVGEQVRRVNCEISDRGSEFLQNVVNSASIVTLEGTRIDDLPVSIRSHVRRMSTEEASDGDAKVRVPSFSPFRESVLRCAPSSLDRMRMYEAAYTVPKNLPTLERLLEGRQKLARLTGHRSYAHLKMKNAMISCPDAAESFLDDVATRIRPKLERELNLLRDLKCSEENRDVDVALWDEWFCKPRIVAACRQRVLGGIEGEEMNMNEYFSIGSVLGGLTVLLDRVFNITMREENVDAQTESWCGSDVGCRSSTSDNVSLRKFSFRTNDGEILGHVYLDLFARAGKPSGASHYVFAGGRWLRDAKSRQLPTVAISCSFQRPPPDSTVVACGVWAADTLIHEFGHALHSLCSRTRYQHLSGTRVPTDFVEIPALLLSKFLWHPSSMSVFTKHHQSGAALPRSLINATIESERTFSALEHTHTAVQGILDLRLHREDQRHDGTSTTRLWEEILDRYLPSMRRPENARWHTQFTHLVSYGSSYYTYLVGKAYADSIWSDYFDDDDPLREGGGVRFRERVLAPGNSKSPREILETISLRDASAGLADSILRE